MQLVKYLAFFKRQTTDAAVVEIVLWLDAKMRGQTNKVTSGRIAAASLQITLSTLTAGKPGLAKVWPPNPQSGPSGSAA